MAFRSIHEWRRGRKVRGNQARSEAALNTPNWLPALWKLDGHWYGREGFRRAMKDRLTAATANQAGYFNLWPERRVVDHPRPENWQPVIGAG